MMGWGNYFSSPTLSGHSEGTLLTLEPADGILGKPAEADKGKEFLPKSAFWISVCSAWSREREGGRWSVLVCVGSSSRRLGAPGIWLDRNVDYTPLVVASY